MNVMIARKRKGLTQEQLCEKVGISRAYLSRIENGKDSHLTKETMLKIANALGETVQYLFFSEEQ